jgi:hypothetical protein
MTAPPPPPERSSAWRSLLQGATRPSLAGLGVTLAVTALWIGITAALLRPAALADHRWVAEPIDDFAWMAGNLVRYQRGDPERFHVAVVGTSAIREALVDAERLERELETRVQRPVRVHLLTAGSLTPLEYLVVADHVPEGAGLVIFEVSERQLGLEPQSWHWIATNPRLPLHSPALRARTAAEGFPNRARVPGVYLSEHLDFYAGRLLPRALQGFEPVPYHLHPVDALGPPQQHEWDRMEWNYEHWLRVFDTFHDPVASIYRDLVTGIHERSRARVVLLQAPRNPQFMERVASRSDAIKGLQERYHDRVQRLSQELGVPYWNLIGPAQVKADDFRDHAHVGDAAARERYTRTLAETIAQAMNEEGR